MSTCVPVEREAPVAPVGPFVSGVEEEEAVPEECRVEEAPTVVPEDFPLVVPSSSPRSEPSLKELGTEFRCLHAGHRYGPRRKVEIFNVITERFGRAGTRRTQVIELLGPPDGIAQPGDLSWSFARWGGAPAKATEVLFWSQANGFVFVALRGDDVLHAGVWYPGE